MLTSIEHFYSLCALTYVVTCAIFAVVRAFHVCLPYKERADYHYPDRKLFVIIFLFPLILLPYVWNPADPDLWMFVRWYFTVTSFFFCGVLMFTYFGKVKQWFGWHRLSNIIGAFVFTTMAVMWVLALLPGQQLSGDSQQWPVWLAIGEGVLTTAFASYAVGQVIHWTRNLGDDNYSNTEDFPSNYAHRASVILIFHLVAIWPVMLSGSQLALAILQVVLSIVYVWLLIYSLPSQRLGHMPETGEEMEQEAALTASVNEKQTLAPEKVAAIRQDIKQMVEEEQGYLNAHLKMQDVADRCSYGRTYVAWVFKNELGGFFNYVNAIRLAHAKAYRKEHPQATVDEVASAAGFVSRQALYSVRRRLEGSTAE